MNISIILITVTSIPAAQAQLSASMNSDNLMDYNWPYMSSIVISGHGLSSEDAMISAGVMSGPVIQTHQVSNPIVIPKYVSFDQLPDFVQVAYATPVQSFGADVMADDNSHNFQRDEVSITVNPLNPNNLVSVSHKVGIPALVSVDCEFSSSNDAGASWANDGVLIDPLFPSPSFQVDPTVTTDGNGYHYYSCLVAGSNAGENNIVVHRSVDGGVTWANPANAGAAVLDDGVDFHDKPWIVADQDPFGTSPCAGNLYLSWTEFEPAGPSPILLTRSTDGGVNWSNELTINGGVNQMSYPFVDPNNGDVYVTHLEFGLGVGGEGRIMISRSTDCGVSFGNPVAVDDPWNAFFFEFIDEQNDLVREPPEVQGCVDGQGNVLVVWRDFPNAASTDSDTYFSNSLDSGATWTAPTVVNAVIPGDQFFPTIHCQSDQAHIAWGDQRFDSLPVDTGLFDVFYRSVVPGLVPVFGAELRVTDSTQDATPAGSFFGFEPIAGDYFDSITNNQNFHVIWTDFDTADPSNAPGSRFVDNGDKIGRPTTAIGGEWIPLDTTMVLAAGAQYTAAWMIPAIVSAIGIAIVIARKF